MLNTDYMKRCAKVRSRLQRRPRTLEYEHIGKALGISPNWVNSFARGRYRIPNEEYVNKLDRYMADNGF